MKIRLAVSLLVVSALFITTNATTPVQAKPFPGKVTEFDSFHAHRKHNDVALSWTHSTQDITHFIIQHSFDGFSFTTIAQVSPEPGWNKYEHTAALPGYNYYRIGASLSNGSIEYSGVEVVRIVRRK